MKKFNLVLIIIFFNIFNIMAQRYETQAYELVEKFDDVEIRFYPEAAKIKTKSSYIKIDNLSGTFLGLSLIHI